jgi:hypothetical protein
MSSDNRGYADRLKEIGEKVSNEGGRHKIKAGLLKDLEAI